jgi:co-chaperonin GroES (HSP10)
MIIPTGYRLLVKTATYDEFDPVFKSAKEFGLEVVKDSQVRYDASVDEGIIVSMGPDVWSTYKAPWAEKGDYIAFAKNAGKNLVDPEDKDTRYVVLNDEDVIAVIKG